MSAKLDELSAENVFGISLKQGIGVHSNLILAVRDYKRAAEHGDPDGANNNALSSLTSDSRSLGCSGSIFPGC
jgi:TPR repeat protein